jgi:hypothetical protein
MAGSAAPVLVAALMLASLARPVAAQRAAVPDDFPGITRCEGGQAVSRIRSDVQDTLLRAQLEAHEAVHRAQAAAESGAMENRLDVVRRFERECELVPGHRASGAE